jgi:uncharacterized membrane-anchored protein
MKTKWIYVLLAVQLTGLVALYLWHAAGLEHPTVMLRTLPVDPRDYLRGDYIILNYEIGQIPQNLAGTDLDGEEVYVVLKDDAGFSVMDRLGFAAPENGERFIRGRIRRGRIEFDLEKYFVPEGRGNPPLPITVEVALREDGRAQIKRLYAAGKPWPPEE